MPLPSRAVGTVPLETLLALRLVSDAPEPEKVVAVAVPFTSSAVAGPTEPIPSRWLVPSQIKLLSPAKAVPLLYCT